MATVRGGIAVKPHVQRFADVLQETIPEANSFGTYNGHSPPEGPTQALDIFNAQTAAGYELQDRIGKFAIANQRRFGVRYVIKWNPYGQDLIWNIERAAEGWRAMATRDHRDHVHVTFYASAQVVVDDEPEIGDYVMSLSVRYVFTAPSGDGEVDWVFDGPSRIFAPVGTMGVLKAADKCKFAELGRVDKGTHDWFVSAAEGWKKG